MPLSSSLWVFEKGVFGKTSCSRNAWIDLGETMFAFKGEKIDPILNDIEPLYFRSSYGIYEGTVFQLKGKFEVFNPDDTYSRYTNYIQKTNDKDFFDFSKHPSERWAIEKIEYKAPALNRNGDGSFRVRKNLIGVKDPESEKDNLNLVRVVPITTMSTMYGVVNNSSLFTMTYNSGAGGNKVSPSLWMTWKSFQKAIVSFTQPEEVVSIPYGTRLKIPTSRKEWLQKANDLKLVVSQDRLENIIDSFEMDEDTFSEYLIVTGQPAKNQYMGAIGDRKIVDVWPEAPTKKAFMVKRSRARKPPFKVKMIQYRIPPYGQYGSYILKDTRSGKPNMFKSKSRINTLSPHADVVHWAIKNGLITIDGKYSGKTELKNISLLNRAGYKQQFDYYRDVPEPYDLKP